MSEYYENWPTDWLAEAHDCLDAGSTKGSGSAGGQCMPGLACYKGWPEEEVRAKVEFAAGLGANQLGVFTLAGQGHYPEQYWWPVLADYPARGASARRAHTRSHARPHPAVARDADAGVGS